MAIKWAVKPGASIAGEQPENTRPIRPGWDLVAGETFVVNIDPDGMVLNADLLSLRTKRPAERLRVIKARRRSYINNRRDRSLFDNVTYDGDPYDNNTIVRNDITGAVSFLHIAGVISFPSVPATISWRDANNVDHDLTFVELFSLAAVMFSAVQTAHGTARALKDAIEAATTERAVNAIDWP